MALKQAVDGTHWNSEEEKQQYIRDYIRYAHDHGLTQQYAEAVAAFPAPQQTVPAAVASYATSLAASPPAPQTAKPAAVHSVTPRSAVSHQAPAVVMAGPDEWELGPRGEHLPTANWRGGSLRDPSTYDKPMAIDLERQGYHEAAEFAQLYLCASCHVLSKVHPRDFDLNGYVRGWQKNYVQGLVEAPLLGALGPWEAGVSIGEAATGERSGLHIRNISSALVYHRTDEGQKMTTRQRWIEGGIGAVSLAPMVGSVVAQPMLCGPASV